MVSLALCGLYQPHGHLAGELSACQLAAAAFQLLLGAGFLRAYSGAHAAGQAQSAQFHPAAGGANPRTGLRLHFNLVRGCQCTGWQAACACALWR